MNAAGIVELTSIAKGIEICDHMIKTSEIDVLEAIPMCPGKYVIVISGEVANVKSSMEAAAEKAGAYLIDSLLLANIDEQVFKAVNSTNKIGKIEALGIIETFSVASCIKASDAAVKAAFVELVEVRLSRGMGGKSFVALTGKVGDVKAAVEAGCTDARKEGMLAAFSVIPSPHEELHRFIY